MSKKAIAQFFHAKRRAKERYGMRFRKKNMEEIIKLIQEGSEVETLYRQSNRVSIKKVMYKERVLYVVYDNERHTIATFLLEEHIDQQAVLDYKRDIERSNKESIMRTMVSRTWEEEMSLTKKI